MSEDYRKKEGEDLVQYVADATTLPLEDCKKILSIVCQKGQYYVRTQSEGYL